MSLLLVVTRPSMPATVLSKPSIRVLMLFALAVIAVFKLSTSVVTRPSKVLMAFVLVVILPSKAAAC